MADNETPLTIPALAWHPQIEVQHQAMEISIDDDDAKPQGGDDDDDEDGDDDEDSNDEDSDLDGMSDADLREALKGARANLKKVNGESARHRAKRNEYRKEIEKLKAAQGKGGDGGDDEDKADVEKVKAEAKTAADQRVIRAEAKTALVRAGLDADGPEGKKRLAKAIRLLDISEVIVDEDDEVDGLDEALDELKEEFPELFKKGRKRRSSNGDDDRGGRSPRQLSATERQAAQLAGKR